ncbi:MAG: hypothetical protein LBB59_04890 [Campylobacteraceae bacterium]|jgi:hypothetical protein|nr:hypothetical protein [Campylobacteraceae bacterium]
MARIACKIFIVLSVIFLFAGCGNKDGIGGSSRGDNGGGSSGGGGTPSLLFPDCSGNFCGADGASYTGSGIGVWRYKNEGTRNAALDVNISNVANRDITIVFTNEGTGSAVLPNIPIDTTLNSQMEINTMGENIVQISNYIPKRVREFNENPVLKTTEIRAIKAQNANTWVVGDQKEWYIINSDDQDVICTATLIKKETLSNGVVVNIWIQNDEYGNGKITETMLNNIAQKLNGIISRATELIGEPWGTHRYSNLIPADEPLNIVFANFENAGNSLWTLGYFYSLNNFLNEPNSNEALAVFIDTELFYMNTFSNGELKGISTIAHELTHAIHFYQRNVLMDDGFNTFLNEMSAVMMEDIAAKKIDTSFNGIKGRYTDWLDGPLYRYNFSEWGAYGGDNSYDIAGSLGSFLLRQYGTDFYRTLFQTSSDLSITGVNTNETTRKRSLDVLDRAIKQYDSGGLRSAVRHWGASIAMLPYDASPTGFGYPRRYEANSGVEFEEFNGADYKQYRKLPTSSSQTIYPYGHFPFLRKTTNNIFTERFSVPPQVSVSVVVQ